MQRDGRVNSGDVSIFYRAFGMPGRTPVLLMHGANYFDSFDWIAVAEALAGDREVASFDKRGFGESGWSPSKDYSVDANMGATCSSAIPTFRTRSRGAKAPSCRSGRAATSGRTSPRSSARS